MAYTFEMRPAAVGRYTLLVKLAEADSDYPAHWYVVASDVASLEQGKELARQYADARHSADNWRMQPVMRFTID